MRGALASAAPLALTPAAAAADQMPLAVGAPAPDTVLVDQRARSVRLADLTRQRAFVVVAFYGSWGSGTRPGPSPDA